jgi:hypothetical protein
MSWKQEVSIFTALNQNHSNIIKFFGLLIDDGDKIQMVRSSLNLFDIKTINK